VPEFLIAGLEPNFVEYEEGWRLQKKIHSQVVSREIEETCIFLEHQPVYTAGKRTDETELPKDGTRFVEVDRGGKITWHGPGQLIGYPIFRLPEPIDVVGYVRWLEQVLIDAILDLGIVAHRVDGRSGVWVRSGTDEVKVAAIGIRVADKVTMHGFALNCNNTLTPYDNIIACGISDAKASTLSQLLGREIKPVDLIPLIQPRLESGIPKRNRN
jgi:lipoyl(octanoyl) transferase